MIRRVLILTLSLVSITSGALLATSFKYFNIPTHPHTGLEFDSFGWQTEFQLDRGRLFVDAGEGVFMLTEHRYLPPTNAPGYRVRNWWVIKYRRIFVSGTPNIKQALKALGLNPTWPRRARILEVQLWFPLVACAIYPCIAFVRGPLRRRRRRHNGLCLHCGYDLTGLTEPRCPECATEFERS